LESLERGGVRSSEVKIRPRERCLADSTYCFPLPIRVLSLILRLHAIERLTPGRVSIRTAIEGSKKPKMLRSLDFLR